MSGSTAEQGMVPSDPSTAPADDRRLPSGAAGPLTAPRRYVELDWDAHPEYGLPRDEWLAARRHGIGSSEVAAILGMDRFATPMTVWLDKIGEGEPEPENESMHFGKKLERVVLDEFAEERDVLVVKPTAMFQHAVHDFALASPDGFTAPEVAIVEAKTGRNVDIWEDGPPTSYVIQVQHQLTVCGIEQGHIAVLLNGRDFRTFDVAFDPLLGEMLMEREAAFWDLVERRVAPDVDGHEATSEALKRLHRAATPGREIELPASAADILARYRETRDRLKVVKENHELAANELRALLGDAEVGLLDGEKAVTWKAPTKGKGRVDLTLLEAEHPDLVAQYRVPSTSRTLRVP